MPFECERSKKIPDIITIKPRVFEDERGWFMETFSAEDFSDFGIPTHFPQDNHSRSLAKNVIRGLHYQNNPRAQGKLVRCIVGEIKDVVVDIRKKSPTYGQWEMVYLSAKDKHILWVPVGFAHGFCTLTEISEVVYKTTNEYSPEHDRAILWNDPKLSIPWNIKNPYLSPKDANAPLLEEADNNFIWDNLCE
ncbi:MAG: dTDP-4-dehydrorhamnose 3,5-epimerase [Deltaproteobacteria bacterium]|nr:dTDP-4-dehydrorhamnose 3,5-epimerase [Deltaproteobacteria bacterium]